MTVSYQYDVASSTSGGFTRLLFKWKGSVYKLVYRELLLFGFFYGGLSITYRLFLNEPQKRFFELAVAYCASFVNFIPLSFVLGFYVTFVAARWWNQYLAIPWPDRVMHAIGLYVGGSDDTSRMVRRSLMRYVNLTLVLVLRSISMAVKKRFPTKEHLIEAGYMSKAEVDMIRSVPSVAEYNTYWIPCSWFVNLLRDAKRDHRIIDSQGLKLIMEELNDFRAKCGMLWSYDWVSIPLVYTQVVTLATYSFFAISVIGRQFVVGSMEGTSTNGLTQDNNRIDGYIPIFTILQFLLYMGLLKVAEQLINPFGDDDEDFELNWIIDRHITVSYLGVDLLNGQPPPLIMDQYFHDVDIQLPYTEAAVAYKKKTYRGSVYTMHVPQDQQHLVLPDITEEEDEDVIAENYNMGSRRPSVWTIIGGKVNAKFGGSTTSMTNDVNETDSDNGSRRISYNSLNADNKNSNITSTAGIRGQAGQKLSISHETLPQNRQSIDGAAYTGSEPSLSSTEASDPVKRQFRRPRSRGSDETELDTKHIVPIFHKSAHVLHHSPSIASGLFSLGRPAVSFSKLKLNKKRTRDLWKKITVKRNLSWGRKSASKPTSRPWISKACCNEQPLLPRQTKFYNPDLSDDEFVVEHDEGHDSEAAVYQKDIQGHVSINIEHASDSNIAEDEFCDAQDDSNFGDNWEHFSIDIPPDDHETFDEVTNGQGRTNPMVKQRSLEENSKTRIRPIAFGKGKKVYQSLPILEPCLLQQQAGRKANDKSVKWMSDSEQMDLNLSSNNESNVHRTENAKVQRRSSLRQQESAATMQHRQATIKRIDSAPRSLMKPTCQTVKFKDSER
ncbi:BEST3 (predicted) [Pycnogonum litorale]